MVRVHDRVFRTMAEEVDMGECRHEWIVEFESRSFRGGPYFQGHMVRKCKKCGYIAHELLREEQRITGEGG